MKILNIFIYILYRTFTVFIGLSPVHTPWSGVFLGKLTGSQLVKKFAAFYGNAFTSACHLSLRVPVTTAWRVSGCGWRNGLQYGG